MTLGKRWVQTLGMARTRWTWDFLMPLGMNLGWVVFERVPGEIQRYYAHELARWDVRQTTTLDLWPGMQLRCRPRYYPTAAFVVVGPTGAPGKALITRAKEIAKMEAEEQARIEGRIVS